MHKKATLVHFKEIVECDNRIHYIFRVIGRGPIFLISVDEFENGFVTLSPMRGCGIEFLAELISGCFAKRSNFGDTVINTFEYIFGDYTLEFKGIIFTFNDITVKVTKHNCSQNRIVQMYNDNYVKSNYKYQLEQFSNSNPQPEPLNISKEELFELLRQIFNTDRT